MEKLENILKKEMFLPSLAGIFLNPFYIARKGLFKEMSAFSRLVSGKVLDVGCGSKPYAGLFKCDEYIGLEIDTRENRERRKADWFYDGQHIPAEASSFDWIVCSQVMEHVFNPDVLLSEMHRVLKPGGGLIITTPFIWDEHEQPNDFARYTSFGITFILEKQGFQVIEQKKTVGDIRIVFQLINAYLYKVLLTRNRYVNTLLRAFCMAPFTVLGEVLCRILPKNSDLYLDNIVVARKRGQ